ncbi:glycerate kinase [Spongiivirga citrea]|uniref:Glycerate kinase n=1 Tax=Spongiivirga citrea TaxID=1481457 RepID=A0A6M0CKX6_9FLAO|nr:glycerate kinase [Spongiivirga citrea]NER16644.1 glycerate kinase [Spongiivirga citrea]
MKFVIAPDKYKGSLTGVEFCNAVEKGLLKVFPDATITKIPLGDGGDGTLQALKHSMDGVIIKVKVNDPVFRPIEAKYLFNAESKTAFIEMAEASGLRLLKEDEINCLNTSSYGTGEIIKDALKKGVKYLYLGIGGSATNEAGIGMATALGFRFLDENGETVHPIGKNLNRVRNIETSNVSPLLKDIEVKVACDVNNTLHGQNGAAYVYAPQKGADDKAVAHLDKGLQNIAKVISSDLNIGLQDIPGTGAAGGMGAGAIAFLKAELTSGIEMIKDIVDFEAKITGADWIITGEGKLDNQTLSGKTVKGVQTSAEKNKIPVAAFCGVVDLTIQEQNELGLSYVSSILNEVADLKTAISSSYDNLVKTSYNFAQLLKANY